MRVRSRWSGGVEALTLEGVCEVDIDRRSTWLLSSELRLRLKLRSSLLRQLRESRTIVHIHIVEVIKCADLVR